MRLERMNWISPVQDTNKWQADVYKWTTFRFCQSISHYRNDKDDDNVIHKLQMKCLVTS